MMHWYRRVNALAPYAYATTTRESISMMLETNGRHRRLIPVGTETPNRRGSGRVPPEIISCRRVRAVAAELLSFNS